MKEKKAFRQYTTKDFISMDGVINFVKSLGMDFYDIRVVFNKSLKDYRFVVTYVQEVQYYDE